MYKRKDVETFLIKKFLASGSVRLFVTDSIRFRLELVCDNEGRFFEKELQFIFGGDELILEFKDWEKEKYLQRMASIVQQAEILINSQ